jgi:hypothetical protein
MYLHPLIHSELSRQRQHQLSRLPLRREPGSRSGSGKQTAATLGALPLLRARPTRGSAPFESLTAMPHVPQPCVFGCPAEGVSRVVG